MEFAIVLIFVFILWTNETLFPKKKPPKSAEEQLTDAIKLYLKDGIPVKIIGGKDQR